MSSITTLSNGSIDARDLRVDGEHIFYDFELTKGQELFAKISSEDYLDVSACSERDYERWHEDGDLIEYERAEEVRAKELHFTAPRTKRICCS